MMSELYDFSGLVCNFIF